MSSLTEKQVEDLNHSTRYMGKIQLGDRLDVLEKNSTVVGTPVNAVNATQTLTIATQPSVGDTFTIGSTVYTFVAVDDAAVVGDVEIGADVAAAKVNIVAAINGTDSLNVAHTGVSASNFSSAVSTLTALVAGTLANAIGTTETFTAVGNVFGGVRMASGVDGTVAEAGASRVDATYVYHCIAANTVSGKNWRRLSLSSY